MKKVLVVTEYENNRPPSYYRPFEEFGPCETNHEILTTNPDSICLAVFTGGSDVSPNLYNEEKHRTTYDNTGRDVFEKAVFDRLLKLGIPMVGICRGSQLLCVLSGGRLVQNIQGHGGPHTVKTNDGRTITVSSTHHQMQLPPVGAEILAWADPRLSRVYEGWTPTDGVLTPEREYDCVYYPNTNCLGMQYHPEFMPHRSEGFQYSIELTKKYLFKGQ
jgi:GMP synthase-like glutamine amidotransferase